MRILLIEPNSQLRQQLVLILQSGGGFDVTGFASSQQAIPSILSQRFDLALGRAAALDKLPVQLARIGFGPRSGHQPPHCLGWINAVEPLPGFAEQVRQLWQRHDDQHQDQ